MEGRIARKECENRRESRIVKVTGDKERSEEESERTVIREIRQRHKLLKQKARQNLLHR